MKSWKTTTTGVLAIVTALASAVTNVLQNHPVDWTAVMTAVMAGVGLISAKDNNVTGGTVKQ